jgi:hypothetical protein
LLVLAAFRPAFRPVFLGLAFLAFSQILPHTQEPSQQQTTDIMAAAATASATAASSAPRQRVTQDGFLNAVMKLFSTSASAKSDSVSMTFKRGMLLLSSLLFVGVGGA